MSIIIMEDWLLALVKCPAAFEDNTLSGLWKWTLLLFKEKLFIIKTRTLHNQARHVYLFLVYLICFIILYSWFLFLCKEINYLSCNFVLSFINSCNCPKTWESIWVKVKEISYLGRVLNTISLVLFGKETLN